MTKRLTSRFLVVTAIVASLTSCQKELNKETQNTPNSVAGFDYATSTSTRLLLKAPSYLANATFEVYTNDPQKGGKLIGKAKLNDGAIFDGNYVLPTALKKVFLKSTYVGLPNVEVDVKSGVANHDFSLKSNRSSSRRGGVPSTQSVASTIYSYMGGFNGQGVPHYLTTPDIITSSLIADCNAALPESAPVPTHHPHYLAAGNQTSLILNHSADVWVTFLHEGAGYKNVLGYYTYDKNNPPASVNDIDSITYIFPNASSSGSGGGLYAGDKVKLGSFTANTAIGWVLLQNAWTGSGVNPNKRKFYSNVAFNPETNPAKRQHNVQLVDNARELVLVGFEDLNRESSSQNPYNYTSDDDFNDLVFYASVVPFNAVNKGGLPPFVGTGNDTDGDGVPNAQDDYPNDPNKAFNNYTPFEGGFTSVAFEDLWPSKGDFDFNDLVVDANYNHITNASNEVVAMDYKVVVRHIGASFHNGYGIQWPFAPSDVSSISGTNLTDGLITNNANGTESGQSKAVMILFDDAFDNNGDTLNVSIDMASPYNFSLLNQEGLNPFLFVNGERGKEIHLINHAPTDLVTNSYFGTKKDVSAPGSGVYYKTSAGEPWAISISHNYAPPVEKVNIHDAYLKFGDWVNSNGGQYQDWYENLPGYRNSANIQ